MRFDKDYLTPTCPADDWSCPYYNNRNGKCYMYHKEAHTPYLECEYWEGSDEAEELISMTCIRESMGW